MLPLSIRPHLRRIIAAVLLAGATLSAIADDPCEESNAHANMLMESLKRYAPASSSQGRFQASVSKDEFGNAARYRIEYLIGGRPVAVHDLKRPELHFVHASVSRDGKRLAFDFNSGGSGCCKCSYEIRASGNGFALTRGQ